MGTLLLPVALTPMPLLLDYPNHLARIWLLAGGIDVAPLDKMYGVDWSGASTNVGVDLLAASFGRLVGGQVLAPMLLGAAVLLPPLGAVMLNRVVFGVWHWWQAGFAVLAWNGTLLAGFLGYQIGLGLALLAASLDPVAVRKIGLLGAMLLRVVLGSALLVFHPFAAGLYGVLLAGLAFGTAHQQAGPQATFGQRIWRAASAFGLGFGVPVLCFMFFAPTLPGAHAPPGVFNIWAGFTLIRKTQALLSSVATYDLPVDLSFVLPLWAAAWLCAFRGRIGFHAGLVLGALGLGALAVIVPSELAGTDFVDWRFPIMAAFTMAASIRPQLQPGRAGRFMAVALTVLALARTGWIADVWRERQADVSAVEDVLALVPAGAAVLPLEHTGVDGAKMPIGRMLAIGLPLHWHLPSLAVPLRHAFVPTLFTTPGKQPLRVLSPWTEIAVPEGTPAPVHDLRVFDPSPLTNYFIGYMANWRARFDYALVVNAQLPDPDDETSVPGLQLLADRGYARLYRIRREEP